MPRIWRWDQGRLAYFHFENIRNIAKCLIALDGIELDVKGHDPLRIYLERQTGLPFLPKTYRVWRNYKRVFECALLATNLRNRLVVTDFCRKLAGEGVRPIDVDEYFALLIPRFSLPFPAFTDFDSTVEPIYPFCAVLKFLIARFLNDNKASIDLDEVFSYIIGNDCKGTESFESYLSLTPTGHRPRGDQKRQVREMLIFLSQLNTLKWYGRRLHLDVDRNDYECIEGLKDVVTPITRKRKSISTEEFIFLTTLKDKDVLEIVLPMREIPTEESFIEGKRSRVTHLKIERSPLLRNLFLRRYSDSICNMCQCNTKLRYPWTDNLLEIHHLLPLSSALAITGQGTSLDDLVGLCPTCHRGVHAYYKTWLKSNSLDDFRAKDEAISVYSEAKGQIVI